MSELGDVFTDVVSSLWWLADGGCASLWLGPQFPHSENKVTWDIGNRTCFGHLLWVKWNVLGLGFLSSKISALTLAFETVVLRSSWLEVWVFLILHSPLPFLSSHICEVLGWTNTSVDWLSFWKESHWGTKWRHPMGELLESCSSAIFEPV
jgi:hypothetical protein